MLLCSLGMFAMGIVCQLYNVFYPDEPYMQQMSFMFVAMPSALAIIHHYYTTPYQATPSTENQATAAYEEENDPNSRDTAASTLHGRKHILNAAHKAVPNHVADTSSSDHRSTSHVESELFGGFK